MMGVFPDLTKLVAMPKVVAMPKAPPISVKQVPMPWPMTAPLLPSPPPPPPPPPPPVAPVTPQKKQSRSVSLELVDLREAEAEEVDWWGGDESDELPQSPTHLYPRTPSPEMMVEGQFDFEDCPEIPIDRHSKLVKQRQEATQSNKQPRASSAERRALITHCY